MAKFGLTLQRLIGEPIVTTETRDIIEWRREDAERARTQVHACADRVERGDVECCWSQEVLDSADIYVLWIERGQRSYDG